VIFIVGVIVIIMADEGIQASQSTW